MENASKALIIAGAILISILLISVGILVMNSTSGVQDEMTSQMDSTQKQSFNAQFTNYAKSNAKASEVKALYNIVNSSNASHDSTMQVEMLIDGAKATSSNTASLSTTKTYLIEIGYSEGTSTGLVSKITVTTNTSY